MVSAVGTIPRKRLDKLKMRMGSLKMNIIKREFVLECSRLWLGRVTLSSKLPSNKMLSSTSITCWRQCRRKSFNWKVRISLDCLNLRSKLNCSVKNVKELGIRQIKLTNLISKFQFLHLLPKIPKSSGMCQLIISLEILMLRNNVNIATRLLISVKRLE